jgi:hypothetical protein
MRRLLAKFGEFLVNRFYIEQGVTYKVRIGRLNRSRPRPDKRRDKAITAFNSIPKNAPDELQDFLHVR